MANIENPKDTVTRFSKSWSSQNPNSLLAEFVSIHKETNRKPDNYHFIVKYNVIIDPNTNRPILDFIEEGVEKDIARDLQEWAGKTEEGLALWISPKKEEVYPCPKVIIHRIAYNQNGEKIVLNSAILFESEIKNPTYKRKTLYTLPDKELNIFKILNWIERKSGQKTHLDSDLAYSQAIYYRSQILSGVSRDFIIDEMQRSGFLGENSISCAGSSTPLNTLNSGEIKSSNIVLEGTYARNCGVCGAPINAYITPGYVCASCKQVFRGVCHN
jgi:hypothetical protein